jgi:hypothetical protein
MTSAIQKKKLSKTTTSFKTMNTVKRRFFRRSFSLAEDLDGFGICKDKPGIWMREIREQLIGLLKRGKNLEFLG